ncbi:MIT domain-containing protein [Entamoeba marina]
MELVNQCIAIFQRAIELENNGKFREALDEYNNGITKLTYTLNVLSDKSLYNQSVDALKMYKERAIDLQQRTTVQQFPQIDSSQSSSVQFPQLTPTQPPSNHYQQMQTPTVQTTYTIPGSGLNQQRRPPPSKPFPVTPTTTPVTNHYPLLEKDSDEISLYSITDSKPFQGQVNEIVQQVYDDVNNINPLPQQTYTQYQDYQPHEIDDYHHPPNGSDDSDDGSNDMPHYQSDDSEEHKPMTQKQRDALYEKTTEMGNKALRFTKSDERIVNSAFKQGRNAQERIIRESERFEELAAFNDEIGDILGEEL